MFTPRSFFVIVLAWFSLLLPASALLNPAFDEFSYVNIGRVNIGRGLPEYHDSTLSKRDICSDTIPGTVTQYCTPGYTLCCVPNNTAIAYPQCQEHFGSGYCCVEENGNCYIDFTDTKPNCTAPGAVKCTALAPGVSEACCPAFTECPSTFNQSLGDARCQLVPASKTASTASAATISLSSGSLATATPTASAASSPSAGLSNGAAAGIGIVSGLAVLCMLAAGLFIYRRGKKKGMLLPNAYSKATVSPYPDTLAVASYVKLDSEPGELTAPLQSWSRSPSRSPSHSRNRSELSDQIELLEFPASGSHEVPELPAYGSHG